MSSIAHQQTYTAPRASPSAAGYNPGTLAPMPFAPTLGAQSTGPNPYNTRLSTPLATAPPPPLHLTSSAPPIPRNSHQQQFRRDHSSPSYGEDKGHSATGVGRRMKYASNEHTLGPTFSEEEDGDDSDWIASKMASLGLDPNGKPYAGGFAQKHDTRYADTRAAQNRARAQAQAQVNAQAAAAARLQEQAQLHQLAQMQHQQREQQEMLQALLLGQPGNNQPVQQAREALAFFQAQQAATTNPQLQAHFFMQAQAQQTLLAMQAQQQQQPRRYADPRQQQPSLYPHETFGNQLHNQPGSFATASDQRNALAAQVQANLLARTNRPNRQLDDSDIRARFESAPNSGTGVKDKYVTPQMASKAAFDPASPYSDGIWKSPNYFAAATTLPKISPQGPPRDSATATTATPGSGSRLPSFLSKRQATEDATAPSEGEITTAASGSREGSAQTSPVSASSSESRKNASGNDTAVPITGGNAAQAALGVGRPDGKASQQRATTTPTPQPATKALNHLAATPRAASYAGPGVVVRAFAVRQPYGPPGEAKELGEKNFQSRLRRQAGINLGMLGRRIETPLSTPVIDQAKASSPVTNVATHEPWSPLSLRISYKSPST